MCPPKKSFFFSSSGARKPKKGGGGRAKGSFSRPFFGGEGSRYAEDPFDYALVVDTPRVAVVSVAALLHVPNQSPVRDALVLHARHLRRAVRLENVERSGNRDAENQLGLVAYLKRRQFDRGQTALMVALAFQNEPRPVLRNIERQRAVRYRAYASQLGHDGPAWVHFGRGVKIGLVVGAGDAPADGRRLGREAVRQEYRVDPALYGARSGRIPRIAGLVERLPPTEVLVRGLSVRNTQALGRRPRKRAFPGAPDMLQRGLVRLRNERPEIQKQRAHAAAPVHSTVLLQIRRTVCREVLALVPNKSVVDDAPNVAAEGGLPPSYYVGDAPELHQGRHVDPERKAHAHDALRVRRI